MQAFAPGRSLGLPPLFLVYPVNSASNSNLTLTIRLKQLIPMHPKFHSQDALHTIEASTHCFSFRHVCAHPSAPPLLHHPVDIRFLPLLHSVHMQ